MKLENAKVLLTGAAGGIGSALAEQLLDRGAKLAMLGRDDAELAPLQQRLLDAHPGATLCAIGADLLDNAARQAAVDRAARELGGIDVLINCAGAMSFRPFAEEDPALLARLVQVNLVAPMLLVRQLLPAMLNRGSGRIVNVGSTFGSIGFAWFAAYSASKFGLRGLSEALRRELDGSGVEVTYVAPRAVKTPLNTDAVYRMAEATSMNMDEPQWVAARIIKAIEKDAKDVYLGFPEKFFARLNSLLPRLVDGGLRKQNRVMGPFARGM
ncbi:MAG: SDR family oxidoreductase [Gammaproteobacteria bacterium]|nr:SDR family oxidoreductase [Gammaproteobacteria bacterium]